MLEKIQGGVEASDKAEIKALYNRIKELLDSDRIRQIRSKDDEDARFGHKTTTSTFFGYAELLIINHITVMESRENENSLLY